MKSANMMVIEKLENEGVASFELTSFKKCESKLIKDASAKGFEFEVKEVYTNEKGREYVRLVKVNQVTTEEQVQAVEEVSVVRTGKKILTDAEYDALFEANEYNMPIGLVAYMDFTNEEGKEVRLRLYQDGRIRYNYLKDGKEFGSTYTVNTKEYKFSGTKGVRKYKSKLPKWLSKDIINSLLGE